MVKSRGIKVASFQIMDFIVDEGIIRSGTTNIASVELVAIQATADVTTNFWENDATLEADHSAIIDNCKGERDRDRDKNKKLVGLLE
jgi:hypothetical protein